MPLPKRLGRPDPEPCDTTPVEMPLGYTRPTPLQDLIASMVRQAIEVEKGEEFEDFDEANDFEEEDPDVLDLSKYEFDDLQEQEPIPPASHEVPGRDRPDSENQTGDPPDQNEVEPDSP